MSFENLAQLTADREKSLSLRDQAQAIINSVKDFTPEGRIISPALRTNREVDDVAAVIAGIKPAALANEQRAWRDVSEELYTIAREHGYEVRDLEGFGGGKTKVVGMPDRVREIIELVQEQVKRGEPDENYHRKLGKLLGYSEQSINDFVEMQ